MRLVIGTPAYGGLFHNNYVESLIDTVTGLNRDGVTFMFRGVSNDALINRARNTIADEAIRWNADKLLFIDADVGWKWEDVRALLDSDKLVVGGTYPKKAFPVDLNYNVNDEHKSIYGPEGHKDMASHERLKAFADPRTGEVAIRHLPTGFMMIDIKVFYLLNDKVAAYRRLGRNKAPKQFRNYFPIRVHDGLLESEDWGFCTTCREHGIEIYLNTNVIVTHRGSHLFEMT
jgi:hypothetical protein